MEQQKIQSSLPKQQDEWKERYEMLYSVARL